jgi:RNA-directed DNA polymerase
MDLEKRLKIVIRAESEKLIQRYHDYHNHVHDEFVRNKKRLGKSAPQKEILKPGYWKNDKKFNPFYVRRRCKSIARSIARNIENRIYRPNLPYIKEVPKSDGTFREVTIYQIPDAAVSKLFFNILLSKNKHRFSSFSYAYRNDRNVHFAIQDIGVDFRNNERTFLAEFDFSDFFGTISHDFLFEQFDLNGFYISSEERFIIRAFLADRSVGIPQGTSISLFLANLTCWSFDQKLEREGVKFSRYADDTIAWAPEYEKICNSFIHINEFSKQAGIKINPKKSDGISLLTRKGLPTEISSKVYLDFLGYSLSVDEISIKESSVRKIKKQISYLLFRNLIQPLTKHSLAGQKIPANDKDDNFLTAMMQVRRYMYGGLSKRQMRNFIDGRTKRIFFKGIMSFYPLVDDVNQLRALDGWLLSVIYRALKHRAVLLDKWRHNRNHMFPFNCSREELLVRCSKEEVGGKPLLEIPSFQLIQRALQKGLIESGIERIMNPDSLNYDY